MLVAVPPPNSPPGNAPEMNDIGTVNPEMFVNVVDCGALVAPIGTSPKLSSDGVTSSDPGGIDATPVP